jgi:hypothetical protein
MGNNRDFRPSAVGPARNQIGRRREYRTLAPEGEICSPVIESRKIGTFCLKEFLKEADSPVSFGHCACWDGLPAAFF